MAVSGKRKSSGSSFVIGLNVVLMIVLAVALVAGVQWIAYAYSSTATRFDLTGTGINSLTEPTVKAVESLNKPVTLTSLYYKTDLETEDQKRYRSTVEDLLELYRATNRGEITVQYVNPLQDHEAEKKLFQTLGDMKKFKEEAASHREVVDTFRNEMATRINDLLTSESAQLDAITPTGERESQLVGQVKLYYSRIRDEIERSVLAVEDAVSSETPAYSAAKGTIQQTYTGVQNLLNSVAEVGTQVSSVPGQFSAPAESFFVSAQSRYADILKAIEEQLAKIQELRPLDFDNLVRGLRDETGNAILVRTADDAKVVDFQSIWPPIDPSKPNPGFAERRFLGEQKLTSTILDLTTERKPLVVFTRFGGPPLFAANPMGGQRQAGPYRQMREQLEDANFDTIEWDLSVEDDPPKPNPPALRTIYVVLRPETQPSRMGRPPATVTPEKLEALKKALGDDPHALFLTGFVPGMMGATPYEYADYLRTNWGIDAECRRVLLRVEEVSLGKFRFLAGPLVVDNATFSNQPIVKQLGQTQCRFPLVAPLGKADVTIDGLTRDKLAWVPESDSVWSVGDLNFYARQRTNDFIVKAENDYTGDFTIAMTAEKDKGKAKIVVISSTGFATDEVALEPEMVLTGQGLMLRQRNPGNVAMFINSLHWLNDNTDLMNLGTPVDVATLNINKDSAQMTFVQALVVAIWPGLALCGGLAMWWVRRR